MAKKKRKLPDPEKPFERAFRPIALAIGYLLRDWNELQDMFMDLFQTVVGIKDEKMTQALWHAVTNDRIQRNMLLRAARVVYAQDSPRWLKTDDQARTDDRIFGEIKWMVERADALGQQRDSAAHSPVAPLLDIENWMPTYIAHTFSGHPRAKDLEYKNLLAEFTLYRKRAQVLFAYAHEWEFYLKTGRAGQMPKRPEWPNLPPAPTGKAPQEKAPPKAR